MVGRMSDTRRQYSDVEKAQALAVLTANDNDVSRTARDLSIPRTTLIRWVESHNQPIDALASEKKKNLADELEAIALKLVAVMPDKIQAATLQQIATSLGITVDKMQLLRGKATERIDTTASIEVLPVDYRKTISGLRPDE